MSYMQEVKTSFFDTNILVYARDERYPEKLKTARAYLEAFWEKGEARTSAQVLNEYFVTVTSKLKPGLSTHDAWQDIRGFMTWKPPALDDEVLREAYYIYNKYRFSWWDSLIVSAALKAKVQFLFSEDLSHGQQVEQLTIVNPFQE